MKSEKKSPVNIDEYISGFREDIQTILQSLRQTIQIAAPEATETISYQMPTFVLNGNLVHFAAFDKHIGFYPTPKGIESFKNELSIYKSGKGSVQFPIDQPLPLDLISRMVKMRKEENLQKEKQKLNKKK